MCWGYLIEELIWTHLSLGVMLGSHLETAPRACKHTSTKRGFFSSAIAFANSLTCGLSIAGQYFEIAVNNACALFADSCAWLVPCPVPMGSPFCTRLTSVGIEDWLTIQRLDLRRKDVMVARDAAEDCSSRRTNSFCQLCSVCAKACYKNTNVRKL